MSKLRRTHPRSQTSSSTRSSRRPHSRPPTNIAHLPGSAPTPPGGDSRDIPRPPEGAPLDSPRNTRGVGTFTWPKMGTTNWPLTAPRERLCQGTSGNLLVRDRCRARKTDGPPRRVEPATVAAPAGPGPPIQSGPKPSQLDRLEPKKEQRHRFGHQLGHHFGSANSTAGQAGAKCRRSAGRLPGGEDSMALSEY